MPQYFQMLSAADAFWSGKGLKLYFLLFGSCFLPQMYFKAEAYIISKLDFGRKYLWYFSLKPFVVDNQNNHPLGWLFWVQISNFSFCHNTFKCFLLQMYLNASASGKGLNLLVAGQEPAFYIFKSFSETKWEDELLLEKNKFKCLEHIK